MRRRPQFLVVVFAVLALLCIYVGDHLIPGSWPLPARAASWGAITSLLAVPLVALLVFRTRNFALAMGPVGLFIFLFSFTALRDLVWLVARIWVPAEFYDASSAAVVALAGGTFVFASLLGRSGPRLVDVDVRVRDLHASLEGFTIVQLSDVHIGRTLRRPFMEGLVATVNGLNPDLVAITGDLVDGTVEQLRDDVAPLREVKSRHGTWFVTGNHDYYSGALPWIAELRSLGVNVLLNAHSVIEHDGGTLVVGGITDHSANVMVRGHESDPHKAMAGAPSSAFKLLLAHQPASAVEGERAGFHLQLSGHTHGGQFFPGTWIAHLVFPFVAGLSRLGEMWIYTSRGAGFTGAALRTVTSEVTRLRLVRA